MVTLIALQLALPAALYLATRAMRRHVENRRGQRVARRRLGRLAPPAPRSLYLPSASHDLDGLRRDRPLPTGVRLQVCGEPDRDD